MYNRYIFDSSPLIDLFKHYYSEAFPSLWNDFNVMVRDGRLMSVREVSKELESHDDALAEWIKQNPNLFTQSHVDELKIVVDIFKNKHFQQIVRRKEILLGKPVADPFIVARAKYVDAYVVTNEKYTDENAAKLPNLCNSLDVKYINLKKFMELENWTF